LPKIFAIGRLSGLADFHFPPEPEPEPEPEQGAIEDIKPQKTLVF
jgi:hypothetical protein